MNKQSGNLILLGAIGIGLYLLYKSIANVGYSINSQLTGFQNYLSGVGSTLYGEGQAVNQSLGNPIGTLASLGTAAGSGANSLFGGGLFGSGSSSSFPALDQSYLTGDAVGQTVGSAAPIYAGNPSYLNDMMVGSPDIQPLPQPDFSLSSSDPLLGGMDTPGGFSTGLSGIDSSTQTLMDWSF